jgi:hypothetical protein
MRKFMALLGAAGMLTILPATPALAGAVIDKDSGICYSIVPDANGGLTGAEVQGSLLVRTNKSWTTMTCHFNLTAGETPARTTKASGFECTIGPISTHDTRINASSGGRMVMTCRYKNT